MSMFVRSIVFGILYGIDAPSKRIKLVVSPECDFEKKEMGKRHHSPRSTRSNYDFPDCSDIKN